MSQPSERMLDLLQQISVLRELDDGYRRGAKADAAVRESSERRNKIRQIPEEMKKLASGGRRSLHVEE